MWHHNISMTRYDRLGDELAGNIEPGLCSSVGETGVVSRHGLLKYLNQKVADPDIFLISYLGCLAILGESAEWSGKSPRPQISPAAKIPSRGLVT